MNKLMEITTNHPDPVHSTKEWCKECLKPMQCTGCSRLSKNWYPKPVDVLLADVPEHRICDYVNFTSLKIFHVDFIEQIRPYLHGFVTGKCLLPDGSEIKEFVTCYTDKRILIRGGKFSRYGECSVCGGLSSTPLDPKYVLRSYLTNERIYQGNSCSMYIDEEIAMELDFSPWPDAELEPIEVRDIPIDERRLTCDPPDPPWYYLY